jgi:hypothetical protein
MPRLARRHLQRGCFHVLNRGNHRETLFHGPEEYAQFLELLAGARGLFPLERPRLKPWQRNAQWEDKVDQPIEAVSLQTLRQSVVRGTPFGAREWISRLVAEQSLETTVRPRGRPKTRASTA